MFENMHCPTHNFDLQPKIETAPTTAEDEEKAKIVAISYIKGSL